MSSAIPGLHFDRLTAHTKQGNTWMTSKCVGEMKKCNASTCILQQDLWMYVTEEGVRGSWSQLSPVVSFCSVMNVYINEKQIWNL